MSTNKSKKRANWGGSIKQLFHFGPRSPGSETAASHAQPTDPLIHKPTVSQPSDTSTSKSSAKYTVVQNSAITLPAASDVPSDPQDDNVSWKGLKALLQVLESAGNLFGPFKMVITKLSSIIDVYDGAAKGREGYRQLSADLDGLFSDLKEFLSGPVTPAMTSSIKNLCVSLESELNWVRNKQRRGPTQKYLEALEDTDALMESYQRIHGYIARLTLNMNMGLWKVLDEQATEGRLNKLSPSLSAVYNSAESDDVDRGPCTPGTRTAELDRLVAWTNYPPADRKGVYWMNGMAGTGKTTIAYSLCSCLEEQGKLAASFFCSRLIPECRNVKLIIPTLAYQLARFSRPFRSALSQALETDPDAHTRSLKVQFENLIAKPSIEVRNALPEDLVVVIDALDECENENSVGQILDILLLSNSKIPIRFLVSSRPEPEIYRRMIARLGEDPGSRLVLHELDAAKVKHDIETYLRQELEEVPLTTEQFSGIVEKSGVLFIYASTAARYIKDGLIWSAHEERVGAILGLSTVSDGTHRAIDELYSTILHIALRNPKLDESNRALLKTLLDIVVCVQEPITTSTLAGLLGLKSGQQAEAFLRSLNSVLQIAERTGLVTTLHASFPDFMFDSRRSGVLSCNLSANHQRLAQACFEAIRSTNVQFNICGFESSYLVDSQVPDIDDRVEAAVSAQLSYACRYWEIHMELGDMNEIISHLLRDFLSSRLLLWMEVLNVKKQLYAGSRDEEILELAHDARWFAMTFANHPVSRGTPHLYVSMLPFWPSSSPVSKCYRKQLRQVIGIEGTAIARRQLSLLATWPYEGVCKASPSPDGAQVVLNLGSRILIVDGTTGRSLVGPLEGHDALIYWVEFSPDGSRIVSGSCDRTIRLWEARNGKPVLGPLEGHNDTVSCVRFSHSGISIASSSLDKSIIIWDSCTGDIVVGPLTGHTNWARMVEFFPDDTRLISGDDDGVVRIWSVQTGDTIISHTIHSGPILCISLSPDGSLAVSGCADFTMKTWNPISGEILVPFDGHTNSVEAVQFSPNGSWIASASSDMTVRVWDAQSGQTIIGPLEGHTDTICSVAFTPDNSRLVTCAEDDTIRVWDIENPQHNVHPPSEHTHWVQSTRYSVDGARIISGSLDSTVCIWNADDGQLLLGPLEGHQGGVLSVDISPDGSRIISSSEDYTLRMWDTQSGELVLGPIEMHTGPIYSVAFSPDGARFASGSIDGTIQLWDTQTATALISIPEGHRNVVNCVRFSPDGSKLVTCSDDQTLCIWDTSTGVKIGPLEGHTGPIFAVAFSPDGLSVVSGSEDRTIRLWDARTGQVVGSPLIGHTQTVTSVDFSFDGVYIASCSDDFTIRVWETLSRQTVVGPLKADPNYVKSVRFSPDGSRVVSSGADLAIRVWDIQSTLQGTD
ncbi:hypothetical protein FRC11_001001 [Ceratobasidium sp. 423]|nr:hypothetical protein FRC11_001001 [Ceratobasidium sp. 423]